MPPLDGRSGKEFAALFWKAARLPAVVFFRTGLREEIHRQQVVVETRCG